MLIKNTKGEKIKKIMLNSHAKLGEDDAFFPFWSSENRCKVQENTNEPISK
jgi:hypothetical protein